MFFKIFLSVFDTLLSMVPLAPGSLERFLIRNRHQLSRSVFSSACLKSDPIQWKQSKITRVRDNTTVFVWGFYNKGSTIFTRNKKKEGILISRQKSFQSKILKINLHDFNLNVVNCVIYEFCNNGEFSVTKRIYKTLRKKYVTKVS